MPNTQLLPLGQYRRPGFTHPYFLLRCVLVIALVCFAAFLHFFIKNDLESLFWFGTGFVLWWNWYIREKQSHELEHLNASQNLIRREYERARESYINILRSMTSGVVVMDVENRITHVNQAALSIFGVSAEHIMGKQIFEFTQFRGVTQLLAQTLDTIPPYFHNIKQAEIIFPRFDGQRIPLGLSTGILRDRQDNLIGYIMICQDLTEVKALREQAERDRRLASLGEMAAGVAHEVRNPLSSVMGFVSVIDEETPSEHPHKPYLQIIMAEIDRTSKVIQDILEFSRQAAPDIQEHDLNLQLKNLLFQMSRDTKAAGVETHAEFCDEAKAVPYDAEQMQQVWLNLLHNAVQAMPKGGKLWVRTVWVPPRAPGSEAGVQVQVEDSGMGIPEEIRTKIFEPFFTSKQSIRGTGLGLSISSRIISDHGGTLDVDSRIGEGTRFTVNLPVKIVLRDP